MADSCHAAYRVLCPEDDKGNRLGRRGCGKRLGRLRCHGMPAGPSILPLTSRSHQHVCPFLAQVVMVHIVIFFYVRIAYREVVAEEAEREAEKDK